MIIVGAGLAGLAAALNLARCGRDVIVLEASDAVGGCCSTDHVSGYTFNNGALYVAVPSALRTAFRRLGIDFDAEVELARIAHPHRTILDDGTAIHLSSVDASFVEGVDARGRHAVIELYAPVSGIASASEWTDAMTRETVAEHIGALERKLPGLAVDTMRVIDPTGFARKRHLYEGALYGIAPGANPLQFFPHRTRIEGLYLAGQTTFPGYGVPSAILSGLQASGALLSEARST